DDNCNGQVDEACLPGISINDNRMPEGSICTGAMKFMISLNHPYTDTVRVSIRTADSTATAGSDYIADAGVIKFLPGQTGKHIYAIIFGDPRPEKNEKFKVILSNPVNAIITDSIGIGTILNDDEIIISAQEDAHPDGEDNAIAALPDRPVKVWPNPASGLFNLQTAAPFKNNIAVQLINARGSIIKQWKLPLSAKQTVHQLNIEDVANGTYMLTIKDDSGNKKTEKIIILK
ncbi:MAG TPA: Calx-beta domain-containing protein, partial [Panacibacter sp.]|nr:Calx-beta domain-containing protein [Panacibacter sp.]